MYLPMIVALMFVLPLASIVVQGQISGFDGLLVARWAVFWMVGVRLLAAGLKQILQPRYTAQQILGLKGDDTLMLVRELGFGNTAIGAAGTASLWLGGWTLPLAVVGAIFYGLAGVNHALQAHRNRLENVAMVSDLFAAVVLAAVSVVLLIN